MSDPHDHHGHSHAAHDHAHGGDAAPPPGPARPEAGEDASTQALSEALRSSFAIVRVVMAGLVLLFIGSGFFTVGTQEKAVVLRFGRPVGGADPKLLGPGAHWAFPYPIDEVVRIPVGQVQSVQSSIGWYATTAAQEAAGTEPPPGDSLNPTRDGYLISADENIIHARGTLRYRIAEPGLRYVLDFASASNAVQNAFNHALLYAAARYRVDDALTRDVAGFRELARERLEQLNRQWRLGILVDQIDSLRLIPPRQLTARFDAVLEAEVRRGKELNEARSYENETVSKARAEARARESGGEAERARLVEFVAAEVERFTNNLPAWRTNRRLFAQQRINETLSLVLTGAQDKVFLPTREDGRPRELRLMLSREPVKPRVAGPPPADKH
jgi:membrane protease subunit HflK